MRQLPRSEWKTELRWKLITEMDVARGESTWLHAENKIDRDRASHVVYMNQLRAKGLASSRAN